jgi:hypothetical protein
MGSLVGEPFLMLHEVENPQSRQWSGKYQNATGQSLGIVVRFQDNEVVNDCVFRKTKENFL